MAIFTTADRDAVKAALITAATEGIASVAVGGQDVKAYTLEELKKILLLIQQDLASSQPRGGMRIVLTKPPGCG